jgi:uncharacterized protein (TIGR00299 family) protein
VKTAYIEPIGGASGNMLLGAFVDAGAELAAIERALRTIPVGDWQLVYRRVEKRGIAATFVDFDIPGDHRHDSYPSHAVDHHGRPLRDVLALVDRSGLSESQKARATAIYTRLGEAEARVHGSSVEQIHFHEVGAVDAVLDVAASCIALDLLEIDDVVCAPFPIGSGVIRSEHGTYPNPPPATWELMRGFATFDGGVAAEMVTPTGAAILTTLCSAAARRPAMAVERVGYGAGSSDFPIPNVTRISIGERTGAESDRVAVLEANIDDMQPQYFELAIERLFAAGALDVWLTPMIMKKSRPAFVCSAIVPLEREADCAAILLAQTTTLGVRVRHEIRYVAKRDIVAYETALGPVRAKLARVDGFVRRTLEYDDLARVARERDLPIAEAARQLEALLPPL